MARERWQYIDNSCKKAQFFLNTLLNNIFKSSHSSHPSSLPTPSPLHALSQTQITPYLSTSIPPSTLPFASSNLSNHYSPQPLLLNLLTPEDPCLVDVPLYVTYAFRDLWIKIEHGGRRRRRGRQNVKNFINMSKKCSACTLRKEEDKNDKDIKYH